MTQRKATLPTLSKGLTGRFASMTAFPKTSEKPEAKMAQRFVVIKKGRKKIKKKVSATKAKTLTEKQFNHVLSVVEDKERNVLRNTAILMLSFYCGLRAQEIAGLQWTRNILTADKGIDTILRITGDIGKREVARPIPIRQELRFVLKALRAERPADKFVIYPLYKKSETSERATEQHSDECDPNTIVKFLTRLYAECGYEGCTSHSGRRTFITNLARNCNNIHASLHDVRVLAGHRSLVTTDGYIDPTPNQHKLVERVWN